MNTDILLASNPPPLTAVLLIFVLYIVCPVLALTFLISTAVLSAHKERGAARICALSTLLFILPPILFVIVYGF